MVLNRPLYLSGEHSAQQNEKRLKELEDKFEKSKSQRNNSLMVLEFQVVRFLQRMGLSMSLLRIHLVAQSFVLLMA